MTPADKIIEAARRWAMAKAHAYVVGVYEVEAVRGLDEWDPKHCAWETKLFYAEQDEDLALQELKDSALHAIRNDPAVEKTVNEILHTRSATMKRLRKEASDRK